ncbi:family 16 glycoside hydrolase [Candidatus Poribacteria bacterium]
MKILGTGCVVLVTLLFGSLALADTWVEDFDLENVDEWNEVVGEWNTEEGGYAETAGTDYAKTMFGDETWTNYTVEVDVTLAENVSTNAVGILVRADENGDNGYRFWIRTDSQNAQFSKWENNAYVHLEQPALPVEVGETYNLKMVMDGDVLQCFVNDELVVDLKNDFRDSGRVGLISYRAYPRYDNLVITGENIPTNLAVQPEGKLAAYWGKIKSL